ncbi:MAG TPA: aminotransferase class V-fold PLP-dependent enzyme [Acidimicrobiales bacterium]|jgi:glutamate/tyrosine decarboxylase-like PLP-dependent enzyme|nr:aminotransferase class V-fold PLP-dependent enzyme [Acidimicrobiales bacterium]
MPLPSTGTPAPEVLAALADLKAGDRDWRAGRVFSLVYSAGEEVHELLEAASALYLSENALNTEVFPSLRRIQADILDAVAGLLGGVEGLAGVTTSGGTESILMAVKAAREWGRAERGIESPSMVLATSAHAAFAKASHYFGVRSIRVPVGDDYRADAGAMAAAIEPDTVLVVASAPSYPQGVIDPVPELAALAAERGLLCHVDACMGGFVLPFLERLGHVDQPWDFRVPGVTSISADVHKYGYAPKGISTVTYRDRALRRYQTFVFDGWLGGAYGSPSMAGTRPAGPLAAAWAVLHHLGEEGYLRLAGAAWGAARTLEAGVRAVPGLAVRGEPDATLVAFGAADPEALDVFAVGDELAARGWYLDRQTPPDSLHATVTAGHAASVDELVADLADAVAAVGGGRAGDRSTTYATLE